MSTLTIDCYDPAAFSELMMKHLLRLPGIANIKTDSVLSTVRQTHVLSLVHISQARRPGQRISYSGS